MSLLFGTHSIISLLEPFTADTMMLSFDTSFSKYAQRTDNE